MEISPFLVYLITRCDTISQISIFFWVFSGLSFLISVLVFYECSEMSMREERRAKLWKKRTLYVFILSLCIFLFLPTSKELASIIIIPAVANNQDVQDVAGEIPKLAKEWIQELRTKGK